VTVVVGTAGHIDHGKTTLLRALTGIDADRLPEERRRGLTIDVGYAHGSPDGGPSIDYVDVPGHDRLVGNMLVGAGEIDACLLVVAADDGPRAQTWEHLALVDALGIDRGIVVVSKADLVAVGRVDEVATAFTAALGGAPMRGWPVVAASATTGRGLDGVRRALAALRDELVSAPARTLRSAAWLAIDRVFTVRGHGTVVTGSARGAPIGVGDSLLARPGDIELRVRAVEVHGLPVERGPTGGRVALNVVGAGVATLRRGQVLAAAHDESSPLGLTVSDRLLVALRRPAGLPGGRARDIWPPRDGASVRLHIGTDQVDGVLGRSLRHVGVAPDEGAIALLRLRAPVATAVGERLVLRRPPPAGLLAGGLVLDALPLRGRARRRETPDALARLSQALSEADEKAVTEALLALRGWLVDPSGPRLAPEVRDDVARDLCASVGAYHGAHPEAQGMPLSALRVVGAMSLRRQGVMGLGHARAAVDHVVEDLAAEGRIVRDGHDVRLPDHRPTTGDPSRAAAMDRLVALLDVPAPPGLRAAATEASCPADAIRELERDGRIVVVDDDLAWSAAAHARLRSQALFLADAGPLTPAALRDATGTSRKYVMALLEDLDRRGQLRRTSAGHVRGPRP
jgi:selenocysteine-specific elongation factor